MTILVFKVAITNILILHMSNTTPDMSCKKNLESEIQSFNRCHFNIYFYEVLSGMVMGCQSELLNNIC